MRNSRTPGRLLRGKMVVGSALTLSLGAGAVAFGLAEASGDTPPAPAAAVAAPNGGTGFTGPAQIVALTESQVVVLDGLTGSRHSVLASHPRRTSGAPVSLQGVALSPDGREAYYAVVTDGTEGTIRRVSLEGGRPSEKVADGISPAASPDGRSLAYAAPGPTGPDGVLVCCNSIVVSDRDSGDRRTWRFADDDPAGTWLSSARLTKLAWAPDSRRLAFTLSYEGDTIAVLDTATHKSLSEAVEVIVPDGGGDSRHPAWQVTTGRLALVNQAFDCCFEDDYAGPPRALSVDVGGRVVHELLPSGGTPEWLDFDASGRHLLSAEGGRLYRRSGDDVPVVLAVGVHAADW